MMHTILRLMCFFILFPLIVSCASNKDVKEIKNMIAESREETYQLENIIELLNSEINDDRIRLNNLEDGGAGLSPPAMELKAKIDKNQALSNTLSRKLNIIKREVKSNSNEIRTIKKEQQNTKRAIHEALLKNNEIKLATSRGIRELEEQYKEKRKDEKESWENDK
ncbi:hypothetical protein DSLASN_05660 [Desulfoluna limicola]|uniref:Lipoprotein n=1 Tax=Desulfoluna limicola TaxID=2810562 RepID=A0ABN6EZ37_9BACT|nr:hypothetical protein [Desulfoluna limicola]BCS94934.1 hypothetical protein DSLASN_05660 [Desulfoluna limicola]